MSSWNVLVVDDEEDIHRVTKIAIKRKTWKGKSVVLTQALSGAEAREILSSPTAPRFDAAIVDVVMETPDAGLLLCDFIRETQPRTLRLVLRTGQAGVAPEEKVLSDYDIDYYLAKTEVTEDRLYATLRACFRASQDIAALMAVGTQLRELTACLQEPTSTLPQLAGIMSKSLTFLEERYATSLYFVYDITAQPAAAAAGAWIDPAEATRAVADAHAKKLAPLQLHAGSEVGLPEGTFVVVTEALATAERPVDANIAAKLKRWFKSVLTEDVKPAGGGVVLKFNEDMSSRQKREFLTDLELFVANWKLSESTYRLQDKILQERMDMVKNMPAG